VAEVKSRIPRTIALNVVVCVIALVMGTGHGIASYLFGFDPVTEHTGRSVSSLVTVTFGIFLTAPLVNILLLRKKRLGAALYACLIALVITFPSVVPSLIMASILLIFYVPAACGECWSPGFGTNVVQVLSFFSFIVLPLGVLACWLLLAVHVRNVRAELIQVRYRMIVRKMPGPASDPM
jgi:hypothetical protein